MLLTSLIDGTDLWKPRPKFKIEVYLSGDIFCSFLWSPLINHLLLKRQRWCKGWNTTYWMTWKCHEHLSKTVFAHTLFSLFWIYGCSEEMRLTVAAIIADTLFGAVFGFWSIEDFALYACQISKILRNVAKPENLLLQI